MARELAQPLVALLLVAAGISGVVLREPIDAVAIAAIVVLNALVGLVEEGRANHALEALRRMEAPHVRVLRDGSMRDIPARELVPGDVLVVAAGDRVPADGVLLDAEGLEVDESVLTGESLPVTKSTGGDHTAETRLSSGTVVTRGRGTVLIDATGARTAMGRLAGSLTGGWPLTPLQVELAKVARVLGIAAVAVAVGVLAVLLLRLGGNVTVEDAFLTAVALAVAAVPEGLATVTAVALAIGVHQMAEHGAIVRRLPAVETLGAATVLVFDKTGTLTENRLQLDRVVWQDGAAESFDGLPHPRAAGAELVAVLCNESDTGGASRDPVEQALLQAVREPRVAAIRSAWPRVVTVPFSSEQGWMGTAHSPDLSLYKGAPEVVLAHCDLSAPDQARMLDIAGELAGEGAKVLALAVVRDSTDIEAAWSKGNLEFVALVALRDPLRSAGPASVAACRQAGIRLVMATGDHPGTAHAIASSVHLAPSDTAPRTGPQIAIDGWPDDPTSISVYARVTPQQKLDLIHRLHDRGEIVAMTGDGVNDAPALHAADIGVALGRSGTDVAREASDMIVTDDDLATMVEAVRRGRMIYAAIQRVIDYLVAGNISEIALVIGVLFAYPDIGVPLLPLQLLWINLLTDGAPAVALGIDHVDDSVLQRPPRSRSSRLLDRHRWQRLLGRGALLASAAMIAMALGRHVLDLGTTGVRTFGFTVLVVTHLSYALVLSPRLSLRSWTVLAVATGIAAQLLAVLTPQGRALLHLAVLPASTWPLVVALALAPVVLLRFVSALQGRSTLPSAPAGCEDRRGGIDMSAHATVHRVRHNRNGHFQFGPILERLPPVPGSCTPQGQRAVAELMRGLLNQVRHHIRNAQHNGTVSR